MNNLQTEGVAEMAVITLADAKAFLLIEHDEDDMLLSALSNAAAGMAERMASQRFGEAADTENGIVVPTELQKTGIKMILARLYENRGGEDLPEQFLQVVCNYFIRPDGKVPI